jgi:hypothetical protein
MPKDYLTWSLRGQLILVAIAALLIWLLTVFFIRPISDALAADNRLHATLLVMELVDEYVRTNSAWPGSWKDLEGIGPNESAGFRWPEDRGEVTTMVYVDFQIDSEDIA